MLSCFTAFMRNQKTNKIELLAPAKDLETGLAAIRCGADAVYIAAEKYGAREAAHNSLADIGKLVAYAHRFYVKVYVTVNTILRDDEIEDAVRLIHRLDEIGVDGVIIQDLGLLEHDLPPIPLIASTQTHNNTVEKVRFLEQAGFQRVTLARELSREEIREIRENTSVELEVFVHGSLCVSYSGQCYMSYAIGGRSGNRGNCAQPCRNRYTLIDANGKIIEKDKYLLSLKDLNLASELNALIELGIESFKIEGRLKDASYVMNIVGYYRKCLDQLLESSECKRSSSGRVLFDFQPDPCKTFNRGYSTYFLNGRSGDLATMHSPKSLGEPIGLVESVTGSGFRIKNGPPLHNGDGICFYDRSHHMRGTLVNRVNGKEIFPADIQHITEGTQIFRNHDHQFLYELNHSRVIRKIGVEITVKDHLTGLEFEAVDEDGNRVELAYPVSKIKAKNVDQCLKTIREQMQKTGQTDFEITQLHIDLEEPPFLPLSGLNTMRRTLLESMIKTREENRPSDHAYVIKNQHPYPEKTLLFSSNVVNASAAAFYKRHGVAGIEPGAENGLDMTGRQVMKTRYCLLFELGRCKRNNSPLHAKEPLFLLDKEGRKFRVEFDCTQCEMHLFLGE